MPPSEIRKEAREALKNKWKKGVHIVLAYLLFSFIIGLISGLFDEDSILYQIINLVYSIVSVSFTFGLVISFMKLKRGEDATAFGFITDGISRFGKAWGIAWHIFIRMLLPIICFVLIIALSIAMSIYNSAVAMIGDTVAAPSSSILNILFIVLEIASVIYIVSRGFLYSLSYCIGYDNPGLKSKDCVKKSAELMKGNRGSYFILQLSFIGWAILAALTFGIGMLWLMPYMAVAEICFYERVVEKNSTK